MRNTVAVSALFALAAGYFACSSGSGSGTTPPFTFFSFDAGSGAGSGSGSGTGSFSSGPGSSTGSATGTGTGVSSGPGSSTGSGSGGPCVTSTAAITGTVGASGGSISRLVFAVVGDTRPANEDDPSGYPTAIINKIFEDIEAQSPHPPLTLATGDYQFSSTGSGSTGLQQVQTYMQSRQAYTGAFFPAMGNHECGVSGGFSTSDNNNCGPNNQGGATPNYNAFMSEMLAPISQTTPYYAINVSATDHSWTAKFVITAANAWDSAQQSWLQTTLAAPTTYTFVVRHEPSDATPPLPPGVAGVDAVLATSKYTLLIEGHNHTYGHYTDSPQAVIIGNGGAPITAAGKDYGYGLFSQRCDGAIVVDEYDYMSGATDSYFHFAIMPDGTLTQ